MLWTPSSPQVWWTPTTSEKSQPVSTTNYISHKHPNITKLLRPLTPQIQNVNTTNITKYEHHQHHNIWRPQKPHINKPMDTTNINSTNTTNSECEHHQHYKLENMNTTNTTIYEHYESQNKWTPQVWKVHWNRMFHVMDLKDRFFVSFEKCLSY